MYGNAGGATTEKSAAFAPPIVSPVTLRSHSGHDDWFDSVGVSVAEDGFVLLSTATPPNARCDELSVNVGTPTSPVATSVVGDDGSLLETLNDAVYGPGPEPEGGENRTVYVTCSPGGIETGVAGPETMLNIASPVIVTIVSFNVPAPTFWTITVFVAD